jgi:hypothetical protein
MYSDSENVKQVTHARTKTEATINDVLAVHTLAMLIQNLKEILLLSFRGLAAVIVDKNCSHL